MLIGRTFEASDPMLKKLLRMVECIFTGLSYADDPIVSMPWIRFFYETKALKLLNEGCKIRDDVVKEQLEYHAQTLGNTLYSKKFHSNLQNILIEFCSAFNRRQI